MKAMAVALIVTGGLAFGAAAPFPAFGQQTLQGSDAPVSREDRMRMKARKVAKEQCKDQTHHAHRAKCEQAVEDRVYSRLKAKQGQ